MIRGYQIVGPTNAFEGDMPRLKEIAHHLLIFLPAVGAVVASASPPPRDIELDQMPQEMFIEGEFGQHFGSFAPLARHLGESRAPEHNDRPAGVASTRRSCSSTTSGRAARATSAPSTAAPRRSCPGRRRPT